MTIAEAGAIGRCASARLLRGRHAPCRFCDVPIERLLIALRDYGVTYEKDKGHVVVDVEVLNAEAEYRRLPMDERKRRLEAASEPPPKQWFEEAGL